MSLEIPLYDCEGEASERKVAARTRELSGQWGHYLTFCQDRGCHRQVLMPSGQVQPKRLLVLNTQAGGHLTGAHISHGGCGSDFLSLSAESSLAM